YITGNESEGAFAETKQGRIRGPVANELVQRHAGVIRQGERGAIDEGDPDSAIGSGLDRVVPVDRITDFDLGSNTAGVHDSDWADHSLDLADCLGRRGPHQLGAAANSAVITWRIADATEHATPPRAVGASRRVALPFLHDRFGGEFISSTPKLKKGVRGSRINSPGNRKPDMLLRPIPLVAGRWATNPGPAATAALTAMPAGTAAVRWEAWDRWWKLNIE